MQHNNMSTTTTTTTTPTLSTTKGRASSPMLNEEEIIIPLNLNPLGNNPAKLSELEQGQYLSLSLSFFSITPS